MYKINDLVYVHTKGLNKNTFIGLNITRFGTITDIISDNIFKIKMLHTNKEIVINYTDDIFNTFVFSDINELINIIRNSNISEEKRNECLELINNKVMETKYNTIP